MVSFRTGGLTDIVDDRVTGALAQPFDPASLAEAIVWVLEDSDRLRKLRVDSRQRANTLFAPRRIAGLYADVYRMAVDRCSRRTT